MSGTIDNPFKFADVIAGNAGALPGSVFILLPGDYDPPGDAAWDCTLTGNAEAPYTFRGMPGARIGPIAISGAHTAWHDCEFAYASWLTRYSAVPGSNPPGLFGWARVLAYGAGLQFRRCVLHDLADVGWGVGASDSLFEDCLTYHIGWDADDRAHGHGYYVQNDASGPKTMRRCVSVQSYATPAKVFGVDAPLEQITIEDCVFAYGKEGYTYVRSDSGAAHDITIRNLLTYGVQWDHSNAAADGGPLDVDGGVIVPPDTVDWYAYEGFENWQAGASIRNLLIVGRRAVSQWPDAADPGWIDDSAYHIIPPSSETAPFTTYADQSYATLAAWQLATGNDASSTYSTSLPAAPRIEVIERSQDSVVVVYNWSGGASVIAPIAGTYQNAMNVAETLALDANDPLPMDGWTVAAPIGAVSPIAAWDNRFGVFLVT